MSLFSHLWNKLLKCTGGLWSLYFDKLILWKLASSLCQVNHIYFSLHLCSYEKTLVRGGWNLLWLWASLTNSIVKNEIKPSLDFKESPFQSEHKWYNSWFSVMMSLHHFQKETRPRLVRKRYLVMEAEDLDQELICSNLVPALFLFKTVTNTVSLLLFSQCKLGQRCVQVISCMCPRASRES